MRIKKDYVLRQVAQTWVVLPLAEETVNFSGMLKLNDSGAKLWKALEQGADAHGLARVLMAEYTVTGEEALADAEAFLQKLIRAGCVDEI